MKRTVRRKYIDNWIGNHSPNGLAKLSLKCGISSSLISKARLGLVPKKSGTRKKLAKCLGLSETELFPEEEEDEKAAS